jgi:hypothetical protein
MLPIFLQNVLTNPILIKTMAIPCYVIMFKPFLFLLLDTL